MNLLRDDHTRGDCCKHDVNNGMRNTHNMIETKYNIVIVPICEKKCAGNEKIGSTNYIIL